MNEIKSQQLEHINQYLCYMNVTVAIAALEQLSGRQLTNPFLNEGL